MSKNQICTRILIRLSLFVHQICLLMEVLSHKSKNFEGCDRNKSASNDPDGRDNLGNKSDDTEEFEFESGSDDDAPLSIYFIVYDKGPDARYCRICFEKLTDRCFIRKLFCGHYYHAQCINKWIIIKSCCPICRTIIRN